MTQSRRATKHQIRREATRAALLDAALTLFHDRGYDATTADDIADAIGQTKGAFYFHFADKADCFLQVMTHRHELRGEWYKAPERYDSATTSIEEVLGATLLELGERMGGRPSFAVAMVDFWLASDQRDEVGTEYRRIYEGWVREIAAFVEALRAGGWVDSDVEPERAASALLALVDGYQIHARLYGTEMDPAAIEAMCALLAP